MKASHRYRNKRAAVRTAKEIGRRHAERGAPCKPPPHLTDGGEIWAYMDGYHERTEEIARATTAVLALKKAMVRKARMKLLLIALWVVAITAVIVSVAYVLRPPMP